MRSATLATLAVVALLGTAAPPGQAAEQQYTTQIAAHDWNFSSAGYWDINQTQYFGGGSFTYCSKLLRAISGDQVDGFCSTPQYYNTLNAAYCNADGRELNLKGAAGNQDSSAHSMYGTVRNHYDPPGSCQTV